MPEEPVPVSPPSSGVSDTPDLSDIALGLYSACSFVKSFLAKLEDESEPGDPLRDIRRKFHAPLHAVLDAALLKARQSQPVPVSPPSSGVSDAPTPQCDCNVELRNLARRPIHDPIEIRFLRCPLHEHAPDLYVAVKAALNMVDGDGAPPDWDMLRAALAKARGEKPSC